MKRVESGEWSLELGIRSEELGIVGKDTAA